MLISLRLADIWSNKKGAVLYCEACFKMLLPLAPNTPSCPSPGKGQLCQAGALGHPEPTCHFLYYPISHRPQRQAFSARAYIAFLFCAQELPAMFNSAAGSRKNAQKSSLRPSDQRGSYYDPAAPKETASLIWVTRRNSAAEGSCESVRSRPQYSGVRPGIEIPRLRRNPLSGKT